MDQQFQNLELYCQESTKEFEQIVSYGTWRIPPSSIANPDELRLAQTFVAQCQHVLSQYKEMVEDWESSLDIMMEDLGMTAT